MTKLQRKLFDDLPASVGFRSKHPLYSVWKGMRARPMGSYETSLLLQGRDSFIAGQPLKAASPLFEALRQAARAQDAEKRGAA